MPMSCTKKTFETVLNKELVHGKKIDSFHPTYFFTHVNIRTYNIDNKLGTMIRRHNPKKFDELYRKFKKKCKVG